jgi:CheY-like chemotaxis protein
VETTKGAAGAGGTGDGRHILCINDTADVMDVLRDVLEEEGYRVTTRAHIDVGLAEVVGLAPDLILIDFMMGSAGDNWPLLQQLRGDERTRAAPLVLLTGAVLRVRAREDELRGMAVPVVFKPFDLDHLVQVVASTLSGMPPLHRVGT